MIIIARRTWRVQICAKEADFPLYPAVVVCASYGVVTRMDPLYFLSGCRTR